MKPDFTKLDYNDIKQSLISFLKSQDKLNGYNYEGSILNILMDVLAYNTHYQQVYNNIAFNEAFLDTAQKRSSIVSIAKILGYIPESTKSATCVVEISTPASIDGSLPNYLIPKNTLFTANKDGVVYYFYNPNDAIFSVETADSSGTPLSYTTGLVTLKEGSIRSLNHVINGANPTQKIILRSTNIDINTINVTVQTSVTDDTGINDIWQEAKNITTIDGTSKVYFIEEGPDGNYRLYFGDGILGQILNDGNLVTITFLEASGEEANNVGINDEAGARVFTSPSLTNVTIVVKNPAFGGAKKETVQSIKYNAPKNYTTQERAVTTNDYSIILKRDFPFIKSLKCWGGEENSPPVYGKVFIAIKPENRASLTTAEKNTITKSLTRDRSVVGIIPEIVDPNLLYLIINCDVKVDVIKNKGSITQLKTKIDQAIQNYITTNLDVFDADLITNELEQEILNTDSSLLSVNIVPQLEYRLIPLYGAGRDYEIPFQNEVVRTDNVAAPSVQTTTFNYFDYQNTIRICRIFDDGSGGMYIGFEQDGKKYSLGKYANKDISIYDPELIGNINYKTGLVKINKFNPINQLNNETIRFFANLVDSDVFVNPNTILTIDQNNRESVKINMIESAFRKPIK